MRYRKSRKCENKGKEQVSRNQRSQLHRPHYVQLYYVYVYTYNVFSCVLHVLYTYVYDCTCTTLVQLYMYKGMNWSEINTKVINNGVKYLVHVRVRSSFQTYVYSCTRTVHVQYVYMYVYNVQRVTVRVLPYFRKYSNIHLRCVYPIGQIEKIYYSAVAVFGRSI